jgi:hypothetical protein
MDPLSMLTAAGWFQGRQVDIEKDLQALASEGFTSTPAAEAFLREYSGLAVALPGRRDPLVIDGGKVARNADIGWSEAYSEEIDAVLVPVAEYSMMTLYVDPSGGLWGGVDNDFGRLGSTLPEVIEEAFLSSAPDKGFDRHVD